MKREDMLLELLADNIPSDPNEFNSETGYGEPQHWITLPYDRSLEITYEDTGDDNRYYSWRVHCNEKEFENDDFHSTMGVIDTNISNDLNFDTRVSKLNWAINVASSINIKNEADTEEDDNDNIDPEAKRMFPDYAAISKGEWSKAGYIIQTSDDTKVEIGLYREDDSDPDIAGTLTLQVFLGDDVVVCKQLSREVV